MADLPCGKKSLVRARSKVIKFASDHGFAPDAEDIALATQEALKNIIQHACTADNNMHFECAAYPDRMVIEVSDEGVGFDTSILEHEPSSPLALHGRGIQIIRGLMDNVTVTSDREGTVIRMEKSRRGQ